eukprot:TRINITY_DN2907_c0_g1_i1.p1 TRINITY_DN2907_c0_g1~~TRINITY_DN2907_c0_g1_i1.p1  ORF type:complete len:432 (-),score=54.69 TRINITY_DN2907_c0_g1_i1:71-1366(-)
MLLRSTSIVTLVLSIHTCLLNADAFQASLHSPSLDLGPRNSTQKEEGFSRSRLQGQATPKKGPKTLSAELKIHEEFRQTERQYFHWVRRIQRTRPREVMPFHGIASETRKLFESALWWDWALLFGGVVVLVFLSFFLMKREESGRDHVAAAVIWLSAAAIFNWITWARLGTDDGRQWTDGYVIDQVFSIEDVFLYELIIQSFQVPVALTRKVFFIVACSQILFQSFLYMGIARWIHSARFLPYVVGFWLIAIGFTALRESREVHEGEKASRLWFTHPWKSLLGDRLEDNYCSNGSIFNRTKDGKLRVTMLGPALVSLMIVNICLAVDKTLTKVEIINSPYIALSSSVLAAFALPELYFFVRELFRQFFLMKFGIGLLMMLFGITFLLHEIVRVSASTELLVMAATLVLCIVLSTLLDPGARPSTCTDKEEA